MLVSVTVMFAVSWLPIQVILLLKAFEVFDVTITNISLQVINNGLTRGKLEFVKIGTGIDIFVNIFH